MRVDPAGQLGPSPAQARGWRWRRIGPGLYVPATADGTAPEQRAAEAAARLPVGGAVGGWAACRLHGAAFFDGLAPDGRTVLPVPLVLGPAGNIRPFPGATLAWDRLEPHDVARCYGVPVTVVERAGFDAMRWAGSVREATVVADMLCAARLTSLRRLADYAAVHAGWRGLPRVHRALGLASEHSRSPQETRLRLIWSLDAGLPDSVLVNCRVEDRLGRLLGVADLLDPESGEVVEFDGADHRSAGRHTDDLDREDRLRRHGLEVVRFTGLDLLDPDRVVDRLRAGRQRAAFETPADRAWVARPAPAGALDALLDRQDDERWLREQRADW
ncbi:hypothetical protein [Nocardioides ferulae]|uniref:hypothetical protein n=1 Tax=Nocardioides ferulae TaxID=2340821 RepID=UPI000EB341BC|nr:hypothetical protein [Nocardioides ferulae]